MINFDIKKLNKLSEARPHSGLDKGFTLIELLVVISIIGLLTAIVLISVKSVREKAKIAGGFQFDASVYHAMGAYAVGLWDFDEGSGLIAKDHSGYGHHGTLEGFSGDPWTEDTPIGRNYALRFDGVDDAVSFESVSQDKITISAWIHLDSSGISKYPRVVDMPGYYIVIDRNPELEGEDDVFEFSAGFGQWATPIKTIRDKYWYHVAASYDSSSSDNDAVLYLNGTSQDATKIFTFGGPQGDNAGTGYIGNRADKTRTAHGIIDDVRIYEGILSEAQIKQIYVEELEKRNLTKK